MENYHLEDIKMIMMKKIIIINMIGIKIIKMIMMKQIITINMIEIKK